MKGRLYFAGAALVVIGGGVGIGFAVGSTGPDGPPSAVISAIDKTMGASSLQVVVEPSPPPSRFHVGPPATYDAPDRYEIPSGEITDGAQSAPTIYVGDVKYFALPARPSPLASRTYVAVRFALPNVGSLTNEQALVFGELLSVKDGVDFERTATGYRFHSSKDETITTKPRANTPSSTIVVDFLGGTVSLHDGYVRQVTVDEDTNGHSSGATVVYSGFDTSARVRVPASYERCSAISPKTPNGEICRALEVG
jgi:hypothetical protein